MRTRLQDQLEEAATPHRPKGITPAPEAAAAKSAKSKGTGKKRKATVEKDTDLQNLLKDEEPAISPVKKARRSAVKSLAEDDQGDKPLRSGKKRRQSAGTLKRAPAARLQEETDAFLDTPKQKIGATQRAAKQKKATADSGVSPPAPEEKTTAAPVTRSRKAETPKTTSKRQEPNQSSPVQRAREGVQELATPLDEEDEPTETPKLVEESREPAVDTDDEAPEEVSATAAKLQADQESQRRKYSQKSAKRTRKSAIIIDQAGLSDRGPPAEAGAIPGIDENETVPRALSAGIVVSDNVTAQTHDADDYLPDNVINALQAKHRLTFEDSDSERGELLDKSRDVSEPDGLESEDSEEEEPASVPEDRRIIKVLDDRPVFKPSASAMEYLKLKMYGSRLRRSKEMLQPLQGQKSLKRVNEKAGGWPRHI